MISTPYIYALICTRSNKISETTDRLVTYLNKVRADVRLLTDKKSIFDAYQSEVDNLIAEPDDIVIMCHDDIEILNDPKEFVKILKKSLSDPKVGIVGAAGTTHLTKSGVLNRDKNFFLFSCQESLPAKSPEDSCLRSIGPT